MSLNYLFITSKSGTIDWVRDYLVDFAIFALINHSHNNLILVADQSNNFWQIWNS